jgi:hypothetical protein
LQELVSRGKFTEVAELIRSLTPREQMQAKGLIKSLQENGVDITTPDAKYQESQIFYNNISLDQIVETDQSYLTTTGMTENERRLVFHGTKQGHLPSLQAGFFTVNPTYRVFTKDVHASLNYKTGVKLETVSDGTVTIWSPEREMLSQGDGTTFSITNPVDKDTVIPESLPKPKNVGVAGQDREYTQYIPGDRLIGSAIITPDQQGYLNGLKDRLKSLSSSTTPQSMEEFLSQEMQTFPGEINITSFGQTPPSPDQLKRTIVVFMYESEMQHRAALCTSGD